MTSCHQLLHDFHGDAKTRISSYQHTENNLALPGIDIHGIDAVEAVSLGEASQLGVARKARANKEKL
jgi:hypothetical protein